MSSKPDIIGLVKELQCLYILDQQLQELPSTETTMLISKNFPALASSLLIAFDALERMKDDYHGISNEALRQIRSLKLQ